MAALHTCNPQTGMTYVRHVRFSAAPTESRFSKRPEKENPMLGSAEQLWYPPFAPPCPGEITVPNWSPRERAVGGVWAVPCAQCGSAVDGHGRTALLAVDTTNPSGPRLIRVPVILAGPPSSRAAPPRPACPTAVQPDKITARLHFSSTRRTSAHCSPGTPGAAAAMMRKAPERGGGAERPAGKQRHSPRAVAVVPAPACAIWPPDCLRVRVVFADADPLISTLDEVCYACCTRMGARARSHCHSPS